MTEPNQMNDLFKSLYNSLKQFEQLDSNESIKMKMVESVFLDLLLRADASEKLNIYRSADPTEGWAEFKQSVGHSKSIHVRNRWKILTKKSHPWGRRRIKHKSRLLMTQKRLLSPSGEIISLRRKSICKLLMMGYNRKKKFFEKNPN